MVTSYGESDIAIYDDEMFSLQKGTDVFLQSLIHCSHLTPRSRHCFHLLYRFSLLHVPFAAIVLPLVSK